MKHIKLFDSALQAIGTDEDTPLVASVRDVDKVMYASENKFGSNVRIVEDGPDFIKGLVAPAVNANGHEYVDLGLPSGTLWATCNIGATSPEEYGDYFMWGSTTPDTNNTCDWAHAPFNGGSSSFDRTYFNEHKSEWLDGDVLKPEYDAAHVNMGGDWRMPTHEDCAELTNNTTWVWTQLNGVNGRLFTSNANGNTMFIPASGLRFDTSVNTKGSRAYLWSSSLDAAHPGYAWELYFNSGYVGPAYGGDYYLGYCVRGVISPN